MLPPSSQPPPERTCPAIDFSFTVEFEESGTATIRLAGEIDHGNAWQLASALEAVAMSGAVCIHLDARGLQFADSSFISATEPWAIALGNAGGELVISEPGVAVGRLLTVLEILAPTWALMPSFGARR